VLGRKQEIDLKLNQFVDGLIIAFAFWLSHKLRFDNFGGIWPQEVKIPEFGDFMWLLYITVPFTPLVLELNGYYNNILQKTALQSIKQYAKALVLIGVIIGGCVVFFKWGAQSRGVLVLLVFVGGGMLLGKEILVKKYIRAKVNSGNWYEDVLLLGDSDGIKDYKSKIEKLASSGVRIVEEVDLKSSEIGGIRELLHKHSIQRVFLAAKNVSFEKVQAAVTDCEVEGVEVWVQADFIKTTIARPSLDAFEGNLMMVFRSAPAATWAILIKRLMDQVLASLILIVTLPLWIFAIIGIKLNSSGGPVFFVQNRGGKNGKPFKMYKFRTMGVDAEDRKKDLADKNEMSGPVFKIESDPRIFPFGAFLRKWSIDELPQLINVIFGRMSLVGPRPLPVEEVAAIQESAHRRRLSVKPGITCIWQISGRNDISNFDDWVNLDLEYIDNWSLYLDIKILLKTMPAVIFSKGAK
jgi:exopolysaccharide biosynthesis polyprenyl glycosylphosphotransferase